MSRPDDPPVAPGDILAGKYRVERVLGKGAMGVVVAAMHVELQERRAIKCMLPSMLDDAESVERFLREARAAVRLKSQHVAKIQDIGRLDTGAPYMVMEYLDGHDLKHVLDTRGPLPVRDAVTYLMQVCEAIAEAHALGIVHRDLKPANLFLTMGASGAPCVKVLDFGIAKVTDAQGGLDVTRTSALLGTPLYMSPEQMRGARNVDGRSDVWALGAILYRMLTGKTPFVGSSVTEICAAVVSDEPDSPAMLRPEVPPGLEAAVMRCLEKTPAKRFATAAELSAAIAPFAAEVKVAPQIVGAATIGGASVSQAGTQPPSQGLKPALMGTAILDSSYAMPSPMSPTAAAHAPPAPPSPIAPSPIAAPPSPIALSPIAAPPAPIAPSPIAPLPAPIAPSPIATETGTRATWSDARPIDATPAKKSSTSVALMASGIAAVMLASGAVAYFALARRGGDATAASIASAPPSPVASVAPTPAVSAAPTVVASAIETAHPAANATAGAPATVAPTPAPIARPAARIPGPAPSKPKSKDAFGSDRK